mmetsp:Transcript_15655/g.41450  ORF Transcript_15655/g.41450 Transcript_15655/m.41450 type:complete len:304 (+) Transcript_15655:902-1813(+)
MSATIRGCALVRKQYLAISTDFFATMEATSDSKAWWAHRSPLSAATSSTWWMLLWGSTEPAGAKPSVVRVRSHWYIRAASSYSDIGTMLCPYLWPLIRSSAFTSSPSGSSATYVVRSVMTLSFFWCSADAPAASFEHFLSAGKTARVVLLYTPTGICMQGEMTRLRRTLARCSTGFTQRLHSPASLERGTSSTEGLPAARGPQAPASATPTRLTCSFVPVASSCFTHSSMSGSSAAREAVSVRRRMVLLYFCSAVRFMSRSSATMRPFTASGSAPPAGGSVSGRSASTSGTSTAPRCSTTTLW